VRIILQFRSCSLLTFFFSLSAVFAWSQIAEGPRSPGGTDAAASLLRRFEERYRNATSLSATFLERYREDGRVARMEAGNAYFLHPGKMRWDYQAPEKNTFLVDGKYVWFYSPADHTVTRIPAKRSEDWRTPLAFLASGMKLSRICSQVEPVPGSKALLPRGLVYSCRLRGSPDPVNSSGRPILFELSPDAELNRIVIPQEGGVELEFAFAGWRWDPTLDKSVFQFAPPPNTVVVDGLLPDTPGLRQ
jgi:outer membrane lipoprotein carrier protein